MVDSHDSDCLHRFDFEHLPVRGLLIHMDASWLALKEHRDYPAVIQDVLGQAVVSAVLLAATVKFDGQLTLQLKGNGPMHLLLAQCTAGLGVRGLARYQVAELPQTEMDIQELAGDGYLTVTLETEDLKQRYQGVVPLTGSDLASSLEAYFEQSEQLPTRLWLHADEKGVAGMLLQRLPEPRSTGQHQGDGTQFDSLVYKKWDDDWQRLQLIADTLKPEELTQLNDLTILKRLFHEDDLRLFDSVPVYFKCRCSRDRVTSMLISLGAEEANSVLVEQGKIEVHCDFCNRAYVFDSVDVAQLFTSTGNVGNSRRH